jgi:cysteine desulfurase
MKTPIYMDNQSTTPVDPRVVEAMLPFFGGTFGNAASHGHAFGREAREAVERSRATVAAAIGAQPDEFFNDAATTESNNLAVVGLVEGAGREDGHIVTAATEHRSVTDAVLVLERRGFAVTWVDVDRHGLVDPADVERAVTPATVLVTLMTANNEVGTLHPIEDVGRITAERGVRFHSDAAQALGKIPVDVSRSGLDAASLSAHKIHGPKGVGALYVRRDPKLVVRPLMYGGGHERGLRPGTPNVPGIVGFARAVELADRLREEESLRLAAMRDRLQAILESELEAVELNGHPVHRLPNNLNVSFTGIDGESLLASLDDVALSTGSACMSAEPEPSHVLRAMGLSDDRVRSSVRFGLGRFNTEDEVDYVAKRVAEAVRHLRHISGNP